jgi:uncharacterized membrane protein
VVNTIFLMCVSFIPFPTALLAEYLAHDGERAATMVYCGTYFAVGILFALLWCIPTRAHRLVDPAIDPATIRTITGRFTIGGPFYVLAFFLALVSPIASLGVCLLVALPLITSCRGRLRQAERSRGPGDGDAPVPGGSPSRTPRPRPGAPPRAGRRRRRRRRRT